MTKITLKKLKYELNKWLHNTFISHAGHICYPTHVGFDGQIFYRKKNGD